MIDKFHIINFTHDTDKDYKSIIKNYIENYFESNITVYHPDYLYQIIWNKKIDTTDICELYNSSIEKYIIKIKFEIRNLIKKDKFKLSSLNNLIDQLNLKISKLVNILDLCIDVRKTFLIKILSEPILISFIELELVNFDQEIVDEIEKLCLSIQSLSNEYLWFLKLMGKSLINNITDFHFNIPNKYNKLYELYHIFDYMKSIQNSYSFLNNYVYNVLEPVYETYKNKFIKVIDLCNCNDLYNLMNLNISEKWFKEIKTDDQDFIGNVKSSITFYLRKNLDFNIDFLRLIILCNNLKLLDNYIFVYFEDDEILSKILVLVNNSIRNSDDIIFINDVISFLSKVNVTDVFFSKYHQLLIERLLSREININNELSIINTLKIDFKHCLVKKIDKVMNDYIVSMNDLNFYHKKYNFLNFDNITTSYLNWNINYNEGYVNSLSKEILLGPVCEDCEVHRETETTSNVTLKDYIINYQEYYNKIYSEKRKLQWLLQYGEVNITYNNINITLLPIQLLVLELFNNNNFLTIDEIISQSFFDNYSNKFKKDIINSLLNSRILKIENNLIVLSNSCDIETNLINISYEYKIESNISEECDYDLAFSREEIIKSIINHHVKIESKNMNELYLLVENDIKYFRLTEELFKKAILSLINFDYIMVNENQVIRCDY